MPALLKTSVFRPVGPHRPRRGSLSPTFEVYSKHIQRGACGCDAYFPHVSWERFATAERSLASLALVTFEVSAHGVQVELDVILDADRPPLSREAPPHVYFIDVDDVGTCKDRLPEDVRAFAQKRTRGLFPRAT